VPHRFVPWSECYWDPPKPRASNTQLCSFLKPSKWGEPLLNKALIHRRTELLTAMAEAQAEDEVEAWARLLEEIPISNPEERAWRDVLESILAQPRTYSSSILTASMERYTVLAGTVGSNITGDEVVLGLPRIVA
jgi:hypothetical protein